MTLNYAHKLLLMPLCESSIDVIIQWRDYSMACSRTSNQTSISQTGKLVILYNTFRLTKVHVRITSVRYM